MLNVGDKVPDFTLPLADAAGSRTPTSLHTILNQGPLILAFYPLAFSGVCTQQVCELRDAQTHLRDLGAQLVAFSTDSVMTNGAFAKTHNLPYKIWSDPNREAIHKIWETQTVAGVHDVAKRGHLIIKQDGTIAESWITDNPDERADPRAIQQAVQNLRTRN